MTSTGRKRSGRPSLSSRVTSMRGKKGTGGPRQVELRGLVGHAVELLHGHLQLHGDSENLACALLHGSVVLLPRRPRERRQLAVVARRLPVSTHGTSSSGSAPAGMRSRACSRPIAAVTGSSPSVRGGVAEAAHLSVLRGEVRDRVAQQVSEPERPGHPAGREVAYRHADARAPACARRATSRLLALANPGAVRRGGHGPAARNAGAPARNLAPVPAWPLCPAGSGSAAGDPLPAAP
jgi:hypothetical protein